MIDAEKDLAHKGVMIKSFNGVADVVLRKRSGALLINSLLLVLGYKYYGIH